MNNSYGVTRTHDYVGSPEIEGDDDVIKVEIAGDLSNECWGELTKGFDNPVDAEKLEEALNQTEDCTTWHLVYSDQFAKHGEAIYCPNFDGGDIETPVDLETHSFECASELANRVVEMMLARDKPIEVEFSEWMHHYGPSTHSTVKVNGLVVGVASDERYWLDADGDHINWEDDPDADVGDREPDGDIIRFVGEADNDEHIDSRFTHYTDREVWARERAVLEYLHNHMGGEDDDHSDVN